MERVATLINKLKEQLDQQQDADKLLYTTQMLLAELQENKPTQKSGKVSVTMPFVAITNNVFEAEVVAEKPLLSITQKTVKKEEQTGWLFDPALATIPTLVHQELTEIKEEKETYELKDSFASENETSLNDILKEDKKEIATTLIDTPVKDLKKAIGINDRYVFINELFRGDENMYERSIKTINSFSIFPEAEYWIQRELKIKLGWEEGSQTVQIFNQLVKRRFS